MPSILIAVFTALLLFRFKKLSELSVIGAAAVLGLVLRSGIFD